MIRLAGAEKLFFRGTADERTALDRISLDLAAGSFTVVIGSNGAGKTTLLNALAGAVMLDAGSVEIDGRDVTHWPEHRRARLVARVLQDPMQGTLPTLTVEENLALAEMRATGPRFELALTPLRRARWRGSMLCRGAGAFRQEGEFLEFAFNCEFAVVDLQF